MQRVAILYLFYANIVNKVLIMYTIFFFIKQLNTMENLTITGSLLLATEVDIYFIG